MSNPREVKEAKVDSALNLENKSHLTPTGIAPTLTSGHERVTFVNRYTERPTSERAIYQGPAIKERFKHLKRLERGIEEDTQVSSEQDSSEDDADPTVPPHDGVQTPKPTGWHDPLQSAFAETQQRAEVQI